MSTSVTFAESQLREALQWIAWPVDRQKELYSTVQEWVSVAVELTENLVDDVLPWVEAELGSTWSVSQRGALEALVREIAACSDNPEIWYDQNSLLDPEWELFRSLASAALTAFGWSS